LNGQNQVSCPAEIAPAQPKTNADESAVDWRLIAELQKERCITDAGVLEKAFAATYRSDTRAATAKRRARRQELLSYTSSASSPENPFRKSKRQQTDATACGDMPDSVLDADLAKYASAALGHFRLPIAGAR